MPLCTPHVRVIPAKAGIQRVKRLRIPSSILPPMGGLPKRSAGTSRYTFSLSSMRLRACVKHSIAGFQLANDSAEPLAVGGQFQLTLPGWKGR